MKGRPCMLVGACRHTKPTRYPLHACLALQERTRLGNSQTVGELLYNINSLKNMVHAREQEMKLAKVRHGPLQNMLDKCGVCVCVCASVRSGLVRS
jgi:hypothetical protein